tara:strand:+ start:1450 stop:1896 length:447 start_codon:yes stop_codon:yes gene_type:complete
MSFCIFVNLFIVKVTLYMKTKLLCTFTDINSYADELASVNSYYDIVFGKIFVLQDVDNLDNLLLTYNINQDTFNSINFYKNTISVHRKKDSNTLYTINSLNALIKNLNGGILDTNFKIDWDLYKNKILLVDDDSYREVSTKLFKIIKI